MKPLLQQLILLCSLCFPVAIHADDTQRIEDLLHRKTFSPDGQTLASEMHAKIEGCAIRLTVTRYNSCTYAGGYFAHSQYIDLRSLNTDKESVTLRDLTGSHYERLKGSVTYNFDRIYNHSLRIATKQKSQISTEEYKNHPDDVDTRLKVIGQRYSTEIDPNLYAMSYETHAFCSGTLIKSPLSSSRFHFYLDPAQMMDFTDWVEAHSKTCEPI